MKPGKSLLASTSTIGGASLLFMVALPASAALVTVQPGGGTTSLLTGSAINVTSGSGTASVGGFSIDYTNGLQSNLTSGSFTVGGTSGNGRFNYNIGSFTYIGDPSGTSTIKIDLGGLYASAGGYLNYYINSGNLFTGSTAPTITALAADGSTILDSYNLFTFPLAAISTPNGTNSGDYRGIQLSTNSIRYLQISGDRIALHDITTTTTAAVPEPSSLLLMIPGIVAMLGIVRRRKS